MSEIIEGGVQASRRRRYLILPILAFGYIFAWRGFVAYVPLYLKDQGMGEHARGALLSVFQIAPLILIIPFGVLGDRMAPRHLVMLGLVLLAAGLSWASLFLSFVPLLVCFVVAGIGGSMFLINSIAIYYKSIGTRRRGLKLGWFSAIRGLGFGVGPLLGGYLLKTEIVKTPMLVGVLQVLPFIVISLLLWDIPGERIVLADYAKELRRKEVLVMAAIMFLFSYHFGVEMTCFSLFLQERLGQDAVAIGYTYFYVSLMLFVVMMLAGVIADRARYPNLIGLAGMALSAAGNAVMPRVGSLGALLVFRMLHTAGDGAFLVFQRVAVAHLFGRGRMGGSMGTIWTVGLLGGFLGTYTSGLIPGNVWPFVVAAALTALGMVILVGSGVSFIADKPGVAGASLAGQTPAPMK